MTGGESFECSQRGVLSVGEKLREEISRKYPKVGDFSTHPINDKLAKMGVRSTKVKWRIPPDQGVRTQYKIETVADRRMVRGQLQDYVHRGYLTDVLVLKTCNLTHYCLSGNRMVLSDLPMISGV